MIKSLINIFSQDFCRWSQRFHYRTTSDLVSTKNNCHPHLLHVDGVPRRCFHVAHPEGAGQLLGLLLGHLALGLQVTLVSHQQEDDAVRLDVALSLLQPVVDVLEGAAVCDVEEQKPAHRVTVVSPRDRPGQKDTTDCDELCEEITSIKTLLIIVTCW